MRQPKPYFRKQKKTWYVQIDGRQLSLGRHKKQAWQKYHQLMANRAGLVNNTAPVARVLDAFLEWCSINRAEGTYKIARYYCCSFVDSVGKRLTVEQLKPKHISQWVDRKDTWSDTTKHDAISRIQRALNWAVKQGHIDRSPIASFDEKPRRSRREIVYSREEFKRICDACSDDLFRNLLVFMWETGCRPIEARLLEARHLDINNCLAVLPESLNKTRRGERVLFLTDTAIEICKSLSAQNPDGVLFRNRKGNAWIRHSVKCRFTRLSRKLGMTGLCAYGFRHSYATEGLKNGVDSVSLSLLMGHSDTAMIARTYQHLSRNPTFLLEQARRVVPTNKWRNGLDSKLFYSY